MYSRFQDRRDVPLRLPENYSGCAFSPPPNPPLDLSPPAPPPVPTAIPTVAADAPTEAPLTPEAPFSKEAPPAASVPSAPPTAPPPGRSYDDVLLLGTILLLWRNAEDSDVLPFLVLLLFCG